MRQCSVRNIIVRVRVGSQLKVTNTFKALIDARFGGVQKSSPVARLTCQAIEHMLCIPSLLPTRGCNRGTNTIGWEKHPHSSIMALPGFILGRHLGTERPPTLTPKYTRSTRAMQLHTWRLRAKVNTAQEPQHNPKPASSRILLPKDSTMKT